MAEDKAFCDLIMKTVRANILKAGLCDTTTTEAETRGSRAATLCLKTKTKAENRTRNKRGSPHNFILVGAAIRCRKVF